MPALTPTAAAIAGERVGTNKLTGKLIYGFDHCVQSTNDWLSPLERLLIRILEPRARVVGVGEILYKDDRG